MIRNNKKALYESIMTSVAREVKKVLNDDSINEGMFDNIGAGINAYKDSKNKEELTAKRKQYLGDMYNNFALAMINMQRVCNIDEQLNLQGANWNQHWDNLIKYFEAEDLWTIVSNCFKKLHSK